MNTQYLKKHGKKLLAAALLAVLAITVIIRFYDLTLDQFNVAEYDTSWADEGAYIHNARSMALFNTWKLENDLFNPMYISPVHNFLMYSSFRLFGVGTFAVRIVPAVLVFAAIIFASLLFCLRDRRLGMLFFVLAGLNAMLLAYSRSAMLEYAVLFFILIILGMILLDNKLSWLAAGILAPFLFFSKITSLFFMAAIPLSLILYRIIYKDKNCLKRLGYFMGGAAVSFCFWMLWLVPNFQNWLFMNFTGYGSRTGFSAGRLAFVALMHLKFLHLMNIISILSFAYVCSVFRRFGKGKIHFIDFFLVASYALFILQTIFIDFALRRFVMLVPVMLLMAARLLTWIKAFGIKLGNGFCSISKSQIIAGTLLVYMLFSLTPTAFYFLQIRLDSGNMHNFVELSREIKKYIPDGEKVYGAYAVNLAVENRMKPYFSYNNIDYANKEEHILPMLDAHEINYAILYTNIFDENELKRDRIDIKKSNVYSYLRDNFKIIAELSGRDHVDGSRFKKVYIYKRK